MLSLIHRDSSYMQGYKEYCQEYWDENIVWFRPTNPKSISDDWFEKAADWY